MTPPTYLFRKLTKIENLTGELYNDILFNQKIGDRDITDSENQALTKLHEVLLMTRQVRKHLGDWAESREKGEREIKIE